MADLVVTVRYFAAAKAATGIETETLQLNEGVTVRDLVNSIGTRGADVAKVLSRCSFLRDGVAVRDLDTALATGGTLDVLPPFAGG
ncbi:MULTISPECIES: MoaD/ThiS family protein [Mycobacteriaceae]|uniref:Molybdopterin synthase sulfur carrier subunit n=2 Tax=Mycolicibacterium TaxID=1866885 RepID=A0A7I7ZP03_9MYCO|nr:MULTISPECIES: MoaD/ThiS family protein [Mycolicibacterium]TXH26845.1 MAG: MoaD/ThiS family protein [Mycobacterium sp.]MCX8556116.1 MoaD/ThiS family protein [Mycolicibacterium mucogenicum]MDX1880782.1 MoaD/ThiS family protein [Mycolicibacterium sp. 141076]RUP33044.1 MAG: MoaD/ThiS family protein [Mycolicibacterium sp.]TDK90023.1 MoaD/ThiS family protein [Mycolicibacterium mucogenicum]